MVNALIRGYSKMKSKDRSVLEHRIKKDFHKVIQPYHPALSRKGPLIVLFLMLGLILASIILWPLTEGLRQQPETILRITGRIEGDETHITAPTATRVNSVMVSEGETVKKGQVLIQLDDRTLRAGLSAANSGIARARQGRRQAQRQASALAAKANKVEQSSKGLLGFMMRPITKPKKTAMTLRMYSAKARSQAAYAGAQESRAQSARSQIVSKLSYFRITSPINGIVLTRAVQPGELVKQGQVLIDVVDLNSLYLRGFVAEGDLAKLKIGQQARAFLDALPDKPVAARLRSIDSKASFTPENIYFKEDRIRQARGVKFSIDNSSRVAKPGMSAEAEVTLTDAGQRK